MNYFQFANIAALANKNTFTLPDGSTARVATLDAAFVLRKSSSLVADGKTVVAPAAGGTDRWERVAGGSITWAHRPTWFLSPATGNDENDGATSSTPIQTHAELMRRVQGLLLPSGLDVTILDGPVDEQIIVDVFAKDAFAYVYYHAAPTPLYSGTITAATNYDDAAGQDGTITDSNLPTSWTASGLVGKLLRITSGPRAGTECFVAADLNNRTARVSQPAPGPWDLTTSTIDVGDNYTVYDLVRFGLTIQTYVRGGPNAQINFETLELGDDAYNGAHDVETVQGFVFASSCIVNGLDIDGATQAQFYNCNFVAGCHVNATGAGFFYNGLSSTPIQVRYLGYGLLSRTISQNHGLIVGAGARCELGLSTWFAAFDTSTGIFVEEAGVLRARGGRFWGKGISAIGILVAPTGTVLYPASKIPALVAPTTATSIGGVSVAYAALPYTNTSNGARIVVSG
jgi:hypothetical protein